MIIIDKDKHPNLFASFAEVLIENHFVEIGDTFTKIQVMKTDDSSDFPKRGGKWLQKLSWRCPYCKNLEMDKLWLKNLLSQNETLLIEYTKAKLGH